MALQLETNSSLSSKWPAHGHDVSPYDHPSLPSTLEAAINKSLLLLLRLVTQGALAQQQPQNYRFHSPNSGAVDPTQTSHHLDSSPGHGASAIAQPVSANLAHLKSRHRDDTSSTVTDSAKPVTVDKPIIVHAGQTFDGKGATFVPTSKIGDGGQSEHQEPLFVIENGGTLKNVKLSGGDGVHFLGNGKMINCINTDVGEDAVTIDGPVNRAHDAQLAGCSPNGLPKRAKVEIENCTFNKAHDKVIQDNAPADVTLDGVHVNGAHTVFRTIGGDKSIDSHVAIKNSVMKGVEEVVFRTDAPGAHVSFENVQDDAPWEVLAIEPAAQSSGAHRIGTKKYSG